MINITSPILVKTMELCNEYNELRLMHRKINYSEHYGIANINAHVFQFYMYINMDFSFILGFSFYFAMQIFVQFN